MQSDAEAVATGLLSIVQALTHAPESLRQTIERHVQKANMSNVRVMAALGNNNQYVLRIPEDAVAAPVNVIRQIISENQLWAGNPQELRRRVDRSLAAIGMFARAQDFPDISPPARPASPRRPRRPGG